MNENELIAKVERKIKLWFFERQHQIGSQIVLNFMELLGTNNSVDFYELEKKCNNLKTFKENFTQLSGKGEKNHAKIFEKDQSTITLWKPIDNIVRTEYQNYKKTYFKPVIIANITYNPTGWRNLYINPKANHSYATEFPGHESLNFKFDKKNIDTNKNIFGYVQWTSKPTKLKKGGTVIFYSKNTNTRKGEIVGIYCETEVLKDYITEKWKGFENDKIVFNLKAKKKLSMLFPIPLNADKYKTDQNKRLVGQIGFSYYENDIAINVVKDELKELSKSGLQKNEFEKLNKIYSFLSGNIFNSDILDIDLTEQDELIDILPSDKNQIISDLNNLKETEPETIVVKQKTYKRDNKTIAQIKILRDFKCQICDTKIKKEKGGFYIEAAHIKPKNLKGRETPENILILCPNHHKEFDYGARKIIEHTKNFIRFNLNEKEYNLTLKIE